MSSKYKEILEISIRSYKNIDQLISSLKQKNLTFIEKEKDSCAFTGIQQQETFFIFAEQQKEKFSFTIKSNSSETNNKLQ